MRTTRGHLTTHGQETKTVIARIARILAADRAHRRYAALLAMLAAVVAVFVCSSLTQGGIAATHEERVLDCSYAGSGAHAHDESCYDADGNLVCPLEERELHTHDDSCYEDVLVCGLDESEGHAHTNECYDESGELVCGLDESEGHEHGESCYKRELVCGQEEVTEEHVHGPGCFRTVTVDDGEDPAGATDSGTNDADPGTTDPDATDPDATDPDATDPGTDDPGTTDPDAADPDEAIEPDNAADQDATGEAADVAYPAQTLEGSIVERDADGNEKVAVAVQVDAPKGALPEGSTMKVEPLDKDATKDALEKAEAAIKKDMGEGTSIKRAQMADITFYDADGTQIEPARKVTVKLSTSLVAAIEDPVLVHVVDPERESAQGKDDDAEVVEKAKLVNWDEDDTSTGDEDTIKFKSDEFSPYVVCEVQTISAGVIAADGSTWSVEVSYPAEAAIPEGAELEVTELVEGDASYDAYVEQAADTVGETVSSARLFDISITKDGKEIHPQAPVSVNVRLDDANLGDEAAVVHFAKAGPEVLESTAGGDEVAFETDGFSVFVIVETTIEETVLASDGQNYKVSVTYGADAGIPEGAELAVSEILPEDSKDVHGSNEPDANSDSEDAYSKYVSNMEDVLGLEKGSAGYVRLFDIKIVDENGEKIQPAAGSTVDVKIELADAQSTDLSVVHFADGVDEGDVVETTTDDTETGKAISFATGGFSIYAITDDTGENARVGYRFYYNGGTQSVLLSTQYFRYKDVHPTQGTALTINEPSIPDVDSTTWNRIFRGWSKTGYNDDDSNLITVETLNNELSGLAESDYEEGTFVDLFANLKDVYYITYVDVNPNNVLATEIIPKAESGNTTFDVKRESELRPAINADTVLEGWYDINEPDTIYEPGQTNVVIDQNVTLYPKIEGGSWLIFDDNDLVWDEGRQEYVSGGASFTPPAFYLNTKTKEPTNPVWAGYEFGGWYTDRECTTPFEFGGTLSHDTTVYAKWIPSSSQYRVIIWKQRTSDDPDASDAEKSYDYVTSYLDESVVTGQTVALDSSYKNIYGSNGTSSDADKAYFTYNANKTDQSVVVKADGTSVLNVYYDRKPVTLNFYTWDYTYTVSTGDNDNNPYKYGDVNGQKARVYWNNGAFRTTDRRNGPVYTGTVYTRSSSKSWQLYESMIGLYGSTFAQNDYSWPTAYWWYDSGNNSGGTSGTRTTVMTAFLPTDVDTTGSTVTKNFYGNTSSGTARINFYVQELDGAYTLREYVTSGGGTFYITDKYIGYHAAQYRANNSGSWNGAGTPNSSGYYNNGTGVSYSSQLDIRFDLNNYVLTFYTNNGSNQKIDYSVPYSKSLAEYANQNPGQRDGYYFLGWYADPGCTEPFDFSQTMPDNNIAVYGKWRLERFRVVIDPGANNVHMGSQATRFRLDYDERIDGGLLETATRAGYILDGWYTDPEFTNRFLFSNPVNASTPGVDMTYHDSPNWAAARAAYGDDTEAYDNVRGILHLYAKWVPDPNSTGINVVYDPGDAAIYDSLGAPLTTVPIDTHMYGFDGTSTAREAPYNYNDLYTFKYWEATTEDGETVHFYPSDPIALGDLTFTEPIYDEETGELLRKTVTLRAVYDQTGDPSRITHITYDGNTFTDNLYGGSTREVHGETRDGTHRISVTLDEEINQTITLPTEDDFYLEGWKLVGWSFTEGTYAEQVAAATDDAPNFTPGQKVAADNLFVSSLNDEGNTLYAMWQPKEYTVTVKQVIEEGVPVNSFAYAYKRGVEDGIGSEPEQIKALTGSNSSFTEEHFEYYDRSGQVIRITTPTPTNDTYDVRVNAIVTKDDGTTEILNPTADGNYRILGDVVITYTYSRKVPVKLQKRDATNHSTVLTGAVFVVTPVEYNSSTQRWENAGTGRTITVDAATIEQYLQEGTYRITETSAPSQYAKVSDDLYLTVKKDEPFTLFTASGGTVDSSVAELDGSGKVLTVYDNPLRTVVLTKLLEGGGDDTFTFRVTVFGSDGTTRLSNYTIGEREGNALTTNNIGVVTLSLGDQENVELNIPHGSKITVEEVRDSRYIASYSWNGADAVEDNVFGSEPVEITANGTLTFTNRHALQKLRIKKIGDDAPDGLAGAEFSLAAQQGTTINGFSNMSGLVSMDGETVAANLGFLPGNDASDTTLFALPNGTYTLTETGEPDYYAGLSGAVTLTVSSDGVTAAAVASDDDNLIAMSGPDSQGVYTLTVTNTRKKATVKVIKNVKGVATDQNTGFDFAVTGLAPSADTFKLYGTHKAAEGSEPEHLHEKEYTEVPYGTTFSVAEASTYTDFDTTIEVDYADGTSADLNSLVTGDLTVNGDITITYTNVRKKIPLKVVKTDQAANPLAGATFTGDLIDDSVTTQVTGTGAAAEAVIVENGAVGLGTYTITETNPPSGYNPLAGPVTIEVKTDETSTSGDILVSVTVNGEESAFATAKRVDADHPELGWVVTVKNDCGVELPNSGGSGTTPIYLLGALLAGIAGVGLVMMRSRREVA